MAHRFVLSTVLSGESCENVWYRCEDVVVAQHVAGSRNNKMGSPGICCKYVRVQRWPLVAPRSQRLVTEAKLGHCAGKRGGRSGKRRVERAIYVSKVKARLGGEDRRRKVVRLVPSCEISRKNRDVNHWEIVFKRSEKGQGKYGGGDGREGNLLGGWPAQPVLGSGHREESTTAGAPRWRCDCAKSSILTSHGGKTGRAERLLCWQLPFVSAVGRIKRR